MVGDAQVSEVPRPLSGVLWGLPGDSGASREVILPCADSPQPAWSELGLPAGSAGRVTQGTDGTFG